MNTLLLAVAVAVLVVLAALLVRQERGQAPEQNEDDARVTPLVRGINYLLADEPDLALQELVQVARLRSEAADVYMALGEMFRSKGEIGRAVRIHQNLLARPDLPSSIHLQAHLALARDFQAGGLLDRALKQYEKAIAIQPDHAEALEACLRIREQSSEWLLAEELLSRLDQVRGRSSNSHRAYLFAELAQQHLNDGDSDGARQYAVKALALDEACAPAYIALAILDLKEGKAGEAEVMVRALWEKAPEHFPLIIPMLLEDKAFYRSRGKAMLLACWQEKHTEELALSWLEDVRRMRGKKEARALLEELDFQAGNLRASLRLAAAAGSDDETLNRYAEQWRSKVKNFACEQCGVEVVEMRWQCPQCLTWGSMHPKKGGAL